MACASSAPWCVIADEARGELVSVDLSSGDAYTVWGGGSGHRVDGGVWEARFDGPRSVALFRNETALLVGEHGGHVRIVDLTTLEVSTLDLGGAWALMGTETAPISLAVDERGAGVHGRQQGAAVVYGSGGSGDTVPLGAGAAAVYSFDLDAAGTVLDARLALEADDQVLGDVRGVAFDAARGELLVANGKGVLASAGRVLGSATPVPRLIVDEDALFADAVAWLGPHNGAILDAVAPGERIAAKAALNAASGALAIFDARRGALWRVQTDANANAERGPHDVIAVRVAQGAPFTGSGANIVLAPRHGALPAPRDTCVSAIEDLRAWLETSVLGHA